MPSLVMFHETYVELIDNNGKNQGEVETLRKEAHGADQMVLFFVSFPLLKKTNVSLTFSEGFSLQAAVMAPQGTSRV